MSKEYEMLRKEAEENIEKQDNLNNVIFTILGLSVVCSTWYENVFFMITIIFISLILQAQIIQCRNVVYYVSTYLSLLEEKSEESIRWEKRLQEFRKKQFGLELGLNPINIINWFSFKCQKVLKNFGNLSLATYMFVRLIQIVISNEINEKYAIIVCVSGSIIYFLNIIFTIAICTDEKMYNKYIKQWREVLNLHEE